MRVLTKDDRQELLEVIAEFEKLFEIPCDHLGAYIWLTNYSRADITGALATAKKWLERKKSKGEVVDDNDLHRYITGIMRGRAESRAEVSKILGGAL
jgi:hypothetical protein